MLSSYNYSFVTSASILRRSLAQLAGRAFLAGSDGKGFPDYLQDVKENYPHVLFAKDFDIDITANPKECASAVK